MPNEKHRLSAQWGFGDRTQNARMTAIEGLC